MKKILSFILVAVLCLGVLTGCELLNKIPGFGGGEDNKPNVTYYPERAAEYITTNYNKVNPITASDYEVYGQVTIAGSVYTVDWSVDNELVKLVDNGTTWTVDVDEKASAEHNYKLTGTITAPDGATATVSFDRTVPKYNVISFEEYMAAEKGAVVTIEGIVVGINGKSLNNKYNHLYLADAEGKGGYYCYSLNDDPAAAGVKVGMTVSVTAEVSPYSGMQETYGGTFAIVDETIKTVEPIDLTEKLAAGESLKNYVGLPVIFKGVTIGSQELDVANSQYLFFTLGEQKAYVRTYVSDFINLTINKDGDAYISPDKTTIDEAHAAHFGWTANASGILVLYSGAPYLIPNSVDCFEYLEFVEKTADEKIAAEIEEITVVENVTENTTITLPLVGNFYDDVTIAWTVDNSNYTIDADGKLVIELADEQVTLTLTATIKCGDKTETKTYTVKVKALSKGVYAGEHVDAPVAGTAYKFYLTAKDGKNYYFNGTISGNYLQTSTNIADGADVFLETVEGGFRFYFMDGETKTYIDLNESGKIVLATENPVAVYTYLADTNCWSATVAGTAYYLGTYSTYTTVSGSKLSYITAENTGVSQFPAGFAIAVPATYVPEDQNAPVAGTAYKFYLTAKDGKNYYFNGAISGNYLQTSTDVAEAVDVFVETVEGGFRFYFMNGETKTYIDLNDSGKIVLATENPVAVYTYLADTNCWSATVAGTAYYLGTYSTYTTVSGSKLSYITAENTGVSQFPVAFATIAVKPIGPSDVTAPKAENGYKFYLTAKDGKNYYFTGVISGNYLQTSTDIFDAIDVFVETVEGGFRFYFMNGETKTYIDLNESGKIVLATENPVAVYTYLADTNCWSATVAGTAYYLGTYSTYTTVSGSKLSYITAENTGVSQFPAGFATIEVIEDEAHEHSYKDVVTAPTCTKEGFTTHSCSCGDSYVDTKVEATGHSYTDGLCVCGLREFPEGTKVADFESFTKGDGKDTSYVERENADGWKVENGRCDEQAAFGAAQQIIINGKTTAIGKVTSGTLTGGIKKLYVDYGYAFSESNGVSIKINIKSTSGEVLATTDITNTELAQNVGAQFVWTLDTAVEGEFVIEIVNNCPSNSTSNKDRYSLWNLAWENV